MVVALLVPLIARLPGVPFHGFDWFTAYFFGGWGFLFFSAFNAVPGLSLYVVGRASGGAPLRFWITAAVLVAFLMWAHGSINLRSSSTAAISLIFIPIYAVAAVVAGWLLGLCLALLVKNGRIALWAVIVAFVAAIVLPVTNNARDDLEASARESRFPVVHVSELPLSKRILTTCCGEPVEALAFGRFGSPSEAAVAVLTQHNLAVLSTSGYTVHSKTPFRQAECDSCVHMYPSVALTAEGALVVATSDGLSDHTGRLLWSNKVEGFSRVVAIAPDAFISYQTGNAIRLHDGVGNIRWVLNRAVIDVGAYETEVGTRLPFAVVGDGDKRRLEAYDLNGKVVRTIPLPDWAQMVTSVSWPRRGSLLIGAGASVAILDLNGKEVLRHVIENTSFRPYHGPDGVALRLRAEGPPYLAVMSHGSSGHARSVLLVFDPSGKLVWQEEVKKLTSILAIQAGSIERLLVGGSEGLFEYRLIDEGEAVMPKQAGTASPSDRSADGPGATAK